MLDPLLLQLGGGSPARLAIGFTEVVTVLLGLAISYIAYRGYRRNRARPMLFVSLGFVLLVGVPGIAGVAFFLLPGVSEPVAAGFTQVGEVLGMASILYGLWMDPE